MKNKISVIIPVYNQEKYIGRCLRSLLDQSVNIKDYEIVIINDGSTDNTSYALNLFSGNNIKIINNEKNKGLPFCLNQGIKYSQSEFIIRVDSDDYVNKNYLLIMRLFLELNHKIDAVACNYFLVDENENILKTVDFLKEPIGCGIMFRKDQLHHIGLYDEKMKLHEEKDLMIRFLKKYKLEIINIPLYRYRRHQNNITNNYDNMEKYLQKLKNKHQHEN